MEKMIQSPQEENFYKLLTVAAIESQLQGLLVFDATEKDLLKFADRWMQILTITYQSPAQLLTTIAKVQGLFGKKASWSSMAVILC